MKCKCILLVVGIACVAAITSAQTGPRICNNREARNGPCVPLSNCDPTAPVAADPDADPPIEARECGGLTVVPLADILRCEAGPAGGHCRDLTYVHCANKAFCIEQMQGGNVVCLGDTDTLTGISGWQTQIESLPCLNSEQEM